MNFEKVKSNKFTSLQVFVGYKDNYEIKIMDTHYANWYFVIENKDLDYVYISNFDCPEQYPTKEICIREAKKYLTKIIKKHNPKIKYMVLTDFKTGDKVKFIELNKTRLPLKLEESIGVVVGFTKTNVKVEVETKTYHVPPQNLQRYKKK